MPTTHDASLTNRRSVFALTLALAALVACASPGSSSRWTTLLDGEGGLDNFTRLGNANWTASNGAVHASSGGFPPSYLVSESSYGNFRLRVEFWASDDANSGVLLRCLDAEKINDVSCYEVNIFDTRVDPTYATASIVGVAPSPVPLLRAGQKWNTYEITADGPHLVVVFNGIKTVDVEDTRLRRGPIALQWARGVVKFRSVQILAL